MLMRSGGQAYGKFNVRQPPVAEVQSRVDFWAVFSRWLKSKSSTPAADSSFEVDLARLASDSDQRPWTQLSRQERIVLAVWQLEAEVNNGGFDQYFHNSAGERAPFAIEALLEIGAPNCAAVVGRATQLVLGEARDWSAARNAFVDASPDIGDALEPVDQEFYLYPDDLEALLRAYVRGQRSGG